MRTAQGYKSLSGPTDHLEIFEMLPILILLPFVRVAFAAQAQTFSPPSLGPTVASSNYTGQSNSTLSKPTIVSGQQFDRFIQIWLENTDFQTANSTPTFAALAKQGILLDQTYALTHPSEPNYVAAVGGDFWGLADDNLYNIPSNISTIVDLLQEKNISWASYQENMPTDGFAGFSYASKNYINPSAGNYTYYVRKHNPLIIYDSVASVPSRAALHRNFNDFAADVNASALPQWIWITPNLVNDAHDTTIDFTAQWLQYWLLPLLNDTRFNDNKTLILLTFDETETYTVNNRILTILLGGASRTVQANWRLGSLGRGDTNKTLSNVYSIVANVTGYQNLNISGSAIPLTNATGTIPGPLNQNMYVPFTAPNTSAVSAGGGPVFVASNLNKSFTSSVAPAAVNLTAVNKTVPASGAMDASTTTTTSASSSKSASSGAIGGMQVYSAAAGALGALVGSVLLLI